MNKKQKVFSYAVRIFTLFSAVFVFSSLILIVGHIILRGLPYLKASLFSLTFTQKNQSMLPSIINTLTIIVLTLFIAIPTGVFSAIYMVEYAKPGNSFIKLVRLTTETLQGIPSIVYGLFGYILFNISLRMGYSILAGGLTMSIMVLPLIIRATEEALLAVDNSYREASYGLGARKLRTVFNVVLPSAVNGIFSGIILAIGRIFGETAALIFTAGTTAQVAGLMNSGSSLAIRMYMAQGEALYINEAYATAFVLLVFVIIINGLSTIMGNRLGRNE